MKPTYHILPFDLDDLNSVRSGQIELDIGNSFTLLRVTPLLLVKDVCHQFHYQTNSLQIREVDVVRRAILMEESTSLVVGNEQTRKVERRTMYGIELVRHNDFQQMSIPVTEPNTISSNSEATFHAMTETGNTSLYLVDIVSPHTPILLRISV